MRRFLVSSLILLGLAAGALLAPAAALAAFGIDPGKVYIDNLYPGARAEFTITVYNQNDYETTFVVRARKPDYTAEDKGYGVFPYPEWITATPNRVTIGAGDNDEVLIVVAMPKNADYSGKKSEVWISFMEEATEGMIKVELCSRVFITTRVEEPAVPEPEVPKVIGEGGVGITAEAAKPTSPVTEPGSPEAKSLPTWAIISPVVGLVLLGVYVFLLVKRRRRRLSGEGRGQS